MQTRLFHRSDLRVLEKKTVYDKKDHSINLSSFDCLNGKDVITAKVSDHHPIIHDGVLFWNIMMQGNRRRSGGFNNAFSIIEMDEKYLRRLTKVANVLSEIVYQHPNIEIIGLCEGPIHLEHVNHFIQSIKTFEWMNRFFSNDNFYKPSLDKYENWGLLMLADKKHIAHKISFDFILHPRMFDKLANRIQLWKLTKDENEKYFALGHFPFGGDEYVTEKSKFSESANKYCDLINHIMDRYANEDLIFCVDFNFNPYLIKRWQDRTLDKIVHGNSILVKDRSPAMKERIENIINPVTVDGILLSVKEKQKHYISRPNFSLSGVLIQEYGLFKSSFHNYLEEKRYENSQLQHEYGKGFKLISRL